MKTSNFYAVTAQQIATHPMQLLKLEATLQTGITDGLFLQLHDSIVTPAEGAVPLKVWPAAECGFKDFKRGELNFTAGCYACLSTTAATKTLAAGGSDKCSALELELADPEIATGSIAGDLTSAVTGLQVWSEATGAATGKRLMRLEVDGTNLTTATQYVQIFGTDTVSTGDKPMIQWPIAVGGTYLGRAALVFGEMGREISNYKTGCTVKISSTTGTLTAPNGTACIKAEYK